MADVCDTCCSEFTIQLRKQLCCPYCEYKSCVNCVKKYLLSSTTDPHCMSCRREWNDDFLDLNFTKSFRTGLYKKHREDILMERELSILPTRQIRVEATLKMRTNAEKLTEYTTELNKLEIERKKLFVQYSLVRSQVIRYTAESEGRDPPAWTLGQGEAKVERAKFIMKCPSSDCRGFLSTAYKCGTCQMWACPDCLVMKGEEKDSDHTCDPGQKESVALIIKESKGCPKCGQRISKIDGCDQMWCPDCHTAFSWVTGQIVNGVIHNPHYYEFLRKENNGVAPRNIGDVPCGGIPGYTRIHRLVRPTASENSSVSAENGRAIMGIHRIASEIQDQRIRNYQGRFTENDNGDLGVKYLMKEISKDDMKAELAKREMKRNKHAAIRAVLEMFVNTSIILLNALCDNSEGGNITERVRVCIESFTNLRKYVNDTLMNISRMKQCSVPQITAAWHWSAFNKVTPKPRKGATTTVAVEDEATPDVVS